MGWFIVPAVITSGSWARGTEALPTYIRLRLQRLFDRRYTLRMLKGFMVTR